MSTTSLTTRRSRSGKKVLGRAAAVLALGTSMASLFTLAPDSAEARSGYRICGAYSATGERDGTFAMIGKNSTGSDANSYCSRTIRLAIEELANQGIFTAVVTVQGTTCEEWSARYTPIVIDGRGQRYNPGVDLCDAVPLVADQIVRVRYDDLSNLHKLTITNRWVNY